MGVTSTKDLWTISAEVPTTTTNTSTKSTMTFTLIPLTKTYFPSPTCPLFKQWHEARASEEVCSWYNRSAMRSNCPSLETCYKAWVDAREACHLDTMTPSAVMIDGIVRGHVAVRDFDGGEGAIGKQSVFSIFLSKTDRDQPVVHDRALFILRLYALQHFYARGWPGPADGSSFSSTCGCGLVLSSADGYATPGWKAKIADNSQYSVDVSFHTHNKNTHNLINQVWLAYNWWYHHEEHDGKTDFNPTKPIFHSITNPGGNKIDCLIKKEPVFSEIVCLLAGSFHGQLQAAPSRTEQAANAPLLYDPSPGSTLPRNVQLTHVVMKFQPKCTTWRSLRWKLGSFIPGRAYGDVKPPPREEEEQEAPAIDDVDVKKDKKSSKKPPPPMAAKNGKTWYDIHEDVPAEFKAVADEYFAKSSQNIATELDSVERTYQPSSAVAVPTTTGDGGSSNNMLANVDVDTQPYQYADKRDPIPDAYFEDLVKVLKSKGYSSRDIKQSMIKYGTNMMA